MSHRGLRLQQERDELRCAMQALDKFYQRVRVTHYPELLPLHPEEEFGVDPLSWVHKSPPRTATPPPPPPPSPPAPQPLPPCSYEREWIELESERSTREYQRLYKLYGLYLNKSEEGLLELWKAIGGARLWRTKLRPSQLTLLLSREYLTKTLRFRYCKVGKMLMLGGEGGNIMPTSGVTPLLPLRMEGSRRHPTLAYPADESILPLPLEWKAFCSYLLPRMPALENLTLIDFSFWPFDVAVLDKTSYSFPELKYLRLPCVACTAEEVVELVQRIPTLARHGDGLWVDESFLKVGGDNHISTREMLTKAKGRLTVLPAKE